MLKKGNQHTDMPLNLNTGYADTDIDADLCIRIMSLCCILKLDLRKYIVIMFCTCIHEICKLAFSSGFFCLLYYRYEKCLFC